MKFNKALSSNLFSGVLGNNIKLYHKCTYIHIYIYREIEREWRTLMWDGNGGDGSAVVMVVWWWCQRRLGGGRQMWGKEMNDSKRRWWWRVWKEKWRKWRKKLRLQGKIRRSGGRRRQGMGGEGRKCGLMWSATWKIIKPPNKNAIHVSFLSILTDGIRRMVKIVMKNNFGGTIARIQTSESRLQLPPNFRVFCVFFP